MRKTALVPVYNEESTIRAVIEVIAPLVDLLIIVDDGYSDGSLALALKWARGHNHVEVLQLPENLGMSSPHMQGFFDVAERLH